MFEGIYAEIWESEPQTLTVTLREADGDWRDPLADIRLDEQAASGGDRNDDAPRPLFAEVDSAKLDVEQVRAFRTLLDNYAVDPRAPETETAGEAREIARFLDTIVARPPMRIAYDAIKREVPGMAELTEEGFKRQLDRIWFDFFRTGDTIHASGFEHVFVGEGKPSGDGIGGYHNWIAFHAAEQAGRVDHLGHNYGGGPAAAAGPTVPRVATISFAWRPRDGAGVPDTLFKPIGGFFVGTMPATEIALGTLAYYAKTEGGLHGDGPRVTLGDGHYALALYTAGPDDRHVRTFFPKFLRRAAADDGGNGNGDGDGQGNGEGNVDTLGGGKPGACSGVSRTLPREFRAAQHRLPAQPETLVDTPVSRRDDAPDVAEHDPLGGERKNDVRYNGAAVPRSNCGDQERRGGRGGGPGPCRQLVDAVGQRIRADSRPGGGKRGVCRHG